MEIIAASYDELYKKAEKLFEDCVGLIKLMNELQEDIERLDIFWDGDANAAFILEITDDIVFINALVLKINSNLKLLAQGLKRYQAMERQICQLINSGGVV